MAEVYEKTQDIFEYIQTEEERFRTERVPLSTNWRDWNMFEHIDRSFTLKNSRFYLGQQDYTRPFNNIILPIANVSYRTEGFDVKDVQMYVDNSEQFHKSFIARKFHNWWATENQLNTSIDESVESYFDYGLTLVKNVNKIRPEVVQLQQIAFCDQTNIMSGPICLKHNYSISELLDMKGRWNSEEIDKVIMLARSTKDVDSADGDELKTPGKYIEVYELHGTFSEEWLGGEKNQYSPQIHIVTYYKDTNDQKTGISLFKGKEPKPVFKALERDPIHGRACGRGGIEELFHSQIWTNYSELHISRMLETVSKVVLKTNKKKVTQLNNFSNIKNGQIIDLDDNGTLDQLVLQPYNKQAFDNNVEKWWNIARTVGAASDPALGQTPASGVPLGTTEIVTAEGQGIHAWRQGKIAEFWQEIYRDWVMPHLQKEINKGHKWLDRLDVDELNEISEKVANSVVNKRVKEIVLSGNIIRPEEVEQMRELIRTEFIKGGEQKFIEALKDEFKDLPMDIEINIAGKKANTAEMVSKLNSVFRTLFTPGAIQVLQQSPEMARLLNEILESSGLSPMNFAGFTKTAPQPPQPPQQPNQQLPEELAIA